MTDAATYPPRPETTVNRDTLSRAALAWYDAGCAVIPIRLDGSKAPMIAWKTYQQHRATRDQTTRWFTAGRVAIAVVCGAVSGQLEMLELEGRAVAERTAARFVAELHTAGLGDLWHRLNFDGYAERTPSGGLHLLYRVDGGDVEGNTRLAARPATPEELERDPADKIKVWIETRGEGGYVIVAPSPAAAHPAGRPWVASAGSRPDRIPTITAGQRAALIGVARRLDRTPASPATPIRRRSRPSATRDEPPGEAFDRQVDWTELLTPAGWTLVRRSGRSRLWRRPGKTSGVSASTGYAADRDRLYVFSTSTPFAAHRPVSKFHFYATMFHGGDHVRAARALRDAGFGDQRRPAAS
ncbi:bifunctional DNA primase/polymerase [Dactylosporangium sp. NPDC051485]|uniref:bifunctional DNA primase/polymerase n=1 Tax=Dactylosporangium sp. NPDC051485 TaxID=3154846 RepID=UPI003441EB69